MAGGLTDRINAYLNGLEARQGRTNLYDPELGNAIVASRRGMANLNKQYRAGTNEASVGYDEAARNLLQARDQNLETNTGNFAGQGILRSGIFATEQGKVGEGYQRDLTAAAQRKQQAMQALMEDRTMGLDNIMEGLRGANTSSMARAAQRRQEEAQAKIEAEYRRRQAFMSIASQQQQAALLRQQLALANRPIPVGGGGGGGGGLSPMDLMAFMAMAQQNQRLQQNNNRGQGKQVIKNSKGRVTGHTPYL